MQRTRTCFHALPQLLQVLLKQVQRLLSAAVLQAIGLCGGADVRGKTWRVHNCCRSARGGNTRTHACTHGHKLTLRAHAPRAHALIPIHVHIHTHTCTYAFTYIHTVNQARTNPQAKTKGARHTSLRALMRWFSTTSLSWQCRISSSGYDCSEAREGEVRQP